MLLLETLILCLLFFVLCVLGTGTDAKNLKNFTNPVLFWRGSNEPLPMKSETILKKHLAQMNSEVFEKMGHGQFLHENPREYAKKLRKFFDTK